MRTKHYPLERLQRQASNVLRAWGMSPELAETTARLMCQADLMGVDSHGISMLPTYETKMLAGTLKIAAVPSVYRRSGATAVIDGGAGLGHPAGELGMRVAMEIAASQGVGVAIVRNSHHFGAAGVYARLALKAGLIGMVCSSATHPILVPTGARRPALGTNPIAFAAPAANQDAFVLDMATTTVAANKVKVYDYDRKPLPPGWVMDADGGSVTDSGRAMEWIFQQELGGLSPLGGTPDMGSHKGYGLAMMIQILGGTLAAASFPATTHGARTAGEPDNVGHFMLALDPSVFRGANAFEQDLSGMLDCLRELEPVKPDTPVKVAGDPENDVARQRTTAGIPLSDALLGQLRALCERGNIDFLLEPESGAVGSARPGAAH